MNFKNRRLSRQEERQRVGSRRARGQGVKGRKGKFDLSRRRKETQKQPIRRSQGEKRFSLRQESSRETPHMNIWLVNRSAKEKNNHG